MGDTLSNGSPAEGEVFRNGEHIAPEAIEIGKFETQPRQLTKLTGAVVSILSVGLCLFQLYTSWVGPFDSFVQRSVHLAFVFPLVFLLYPISRKRKGEQRISALDVLLAAAGVITTVWITFNHIRLLENPGSSIPADFVLGLVLLVVIFEGGRRILGWALPLFGILLIVYALAGPGLPGIWAHRAFSLKMVVEALYLGTNGIWGFIVGISATTIAAFLIFGVVLSKTGGADTFVDLALRIAGRSYGGPAKVACFSSAFFGTVSGSAVANCVVDGVFTIPLMKGQGYKKELAGAVEAVASSGGQLVPPVMGAGAFIMAELLNLPYSRIALAAVVPALLYYANCFMGIHFTARKLALKPVPRELIPSFFKKILPRSAGFVFPLSVLLFMLSTGYNIDVSVFYSVLLSAGIYLIPKKRDPSLRVKLLTLFHALDEGGRTVVMIAALCASAQIVVGMLVITGVGVKISTTITGLSGGSVFLALVFSMLVSLVMGMGVPTTAAYVVSVSVAAPSLISMGVPPLSAHMFIFYFAVLSAITPPVCPAVYVASAIAGSDWWPTALIACRLGLAGFIVPYMFYYAPALLFVGKADIILIESVTAFMGVVSLSAGVTGFLSSRLSVPKRLLLIGTGGMLIMPSLWTDLIGLFILTILYFNFAKLFLFSSGKKQKVNIMPSERKHFADRER